MLSRNYQLSFNGGEISPEMSGRFDARRHGTGVSTMLNAQPTPRGAAVSRPGLEHVSTSNSVFNSRLIPFIYSDGQSLCLEFGALANNVGIVRFHTDGGTLQYATAVQIASVVSGASGGAAYLVSAERHGLADGQQVQIQSDGGTIPSDLSGFGVYRVIVRDATSFWLEVGDTQNPANAVAIAGDATGTLWIYDWSELPPPFLPTQNVAATKWVGNQLVNLLHPFVENDTVRFRNPTGLPTEINENQTYWVRVISASVLEFAEYELGPSITLSGSPLGTFELDRYYLNGESYYWAGASPGINWVTSDYAETASSPTALTFHTMPFDGTYEIQSPFNTDEIVNEIHYAQRGDVMTIVHDNIAPYELSRLGPTRWSLLPRVLGPVLPAPQNPSATENRGEGFDITQRAEGIVIPQSALFAADYFFSEGCPFAFGDGLISGSTVGGLNNGSYYTVARVGSAPGGPNRCSLRLQTGPGVWVDVTYNGPIEAISATVYRATPGAATSQTYKVTAVDGDDVEGDPSAPFSVNNVLESRGAENTLTWDVVVGAFRYFVYREENGIYAFIGETETTTFVDDNISPDFEATLPVADTDATSSNFKARAVTSFEQRSVFGGYLPQTIWLSSTGKEDNFTYRLPLQATDRIRLTFASNQRQEIRHFVVLGDLLVVTDTAVWRASSDGGGAITPTNLSIRPQSYVGATMVTPVVVNTSMIYCEARGGRIRELGFNWQRQSYTTGDVSIRASHLFDGYEVRDLAYQRVPIPTIWAPSTSGRILTLTYIPEEEVGSWSQHSTGTSSGGESSVWSVCNLPEGDEDRVYMSVARSINGSVVRTIERLGTSSFDDILTSARMDAWSEFNGLSSAAGALTFADPAGGSPDLRLGSTVRITTPSLGAFAPTDVGRRIMLPNSAGPDWYVEITAYVDGKTIDAEVVVRDLPRILYTDVATVWWLCSRTISGLSRLEGETVKAVWTNQSDNTPTIETLTVQNGEIELTGHASRAFVGMPYEVRMETLPLDAQIEALGQGRLKNVNRVHLRVNSTGSLDVGPSVDELVPVEGLEDATLKTGEFRAVVPGDWNSDARVVIRQTEPVPTSIIGLTIEASIAE